MNKREVCDLLGRSKRTVESYIKDGLPVAYIRGQNGNTAVFDRAAVEAWQRRKDEAWQNEERWHKAKPALAAPSVAVAPTSAASDPLASLAAHLAKLAAAFPSRPPAVGKWLTLDQAAEQSGLPKSWLLAQARSGAAFALNVGSAKKAVWRFRSDGV
jgi:hypothetical protein